MYGSRLAMLGALASMLLVTPAPPWQVASAAVPSKAVVSTVAKLTTRPDALPDDEIARLVRMSEEIRGTKKVGKYLGSPQRPNEVLEDAYMRIALSQGKLSRRDAEGMFQRLGGTNGFRGTLSKVVGNSEAKTAGHLNELRIADSAAQHGFAVKGIGLRFNDGLKHADTDIDVLLERRGKWIAIEAKDYAPDTRIPMDAFRQDMDTLRQFVSARHPERVIPVFSITHRPLDERLWRTLQKEAKRRNVQLIEGSPESQVVQIERLASLL